MSIDVKQQLTNCLSADQTSISIPATLFDSSGPVYQAIYQFVSTGKLDLQGPNGTKIVITGDANSATLTASGTNAPFGNTVVTLTLTVSGGSVDISLTATIQPNWKLATAWPSIGYPFSELEITDGSIALDVNVGDESAAVLVTVNASTYKGQTLSTGKAAGLLKVTWSNGALGFGAGFVVTGAWDPLSDLGINSFTTIQIDEIGLFLTTIDLGKDDLAVFKSVVSGGIAFLPDTIDKGLTLLAALEMTEDVDVLNKLITGKPSLDLTGYISSSGDKIALSAKLEDVTVGNFVTFNEIDLDWESSAELKKISLSVVSLLNNSDINLVNTGFCGTGTLIYSAPQSATFSVEIGQCGGSGQAWTDPFYIKNLAIDNFGLELVLQESQPPVAINLGGTITIGSGAGAADITVYSGLTFDGEIPAPSGIVFKLAPHDAGKTVSLADVIDDVASVFGQNFNLKGTLLDDLSIAELQIAVVQVPFTFQGVTYTPFVSIVGDIFVSVGSDKYELDMILTVNTQADPPYMQACGTFNKNGGAVTIDVGSVNLLTMSNVTGTGGPAACVDTLALTSASDFCGNQCKAVAPGGTGYFLVANAKMSVLSLGGASINAKVAKDTFDFQMQFNWLGNFLTTELACTFAPSEGDFAAAIEFGANLPNLTIDWGFIGSFTIPLPSLNVCAAVGTFVPSDPVFDQGICSGWKPASAPYFYFTGDFSWGSLDWSVTISIDASTFQQIATAFTDFGQFLVTWIQNNVGTFLKEIVESLENLLRLLYQIGWAMWDAVKAVYDFFANLSWTDVFNAAEEIWADVVDGACAQVQAEQAYSGTLKSVRPVLMPALASLADSDEGQEVLFHYYLHQDEITELLRSDRESGRQAARVVKEHLVRERTHPTGRHIPAAMRALAQIAPYASDELQSSINAVAGQLHGYRHLDHASFVAALGH